MTIPTTGAKALVTVRTTDVASSTTDVRMKEFSMLLMHQELARERMRDAQRRAEVHNRRRRLVVARKWERRAVNASRQARLALAAVV